MSTNTKGCTLTQCRHNTACTHPHAHAHTHMHMYTHTHMQDTYSHTYTGTPTSTHCPLQRHPKHCRGTEQLYTGPGEHAREENAPTYKIHKKESRADSRPNAEPRGRRPPDTALGHKGGGKSNSQNVNIFYIFNSVNRISRWGTKREHCANHMPMGSQHPKQGANFFVYTGPL